MAKSKNSKPASAFWDSARNRALTSRCDTN